MGDDLDFEAWYLAHHARMVAALVLTTGNADLARDAVDEAFARALDRWERVSQMESPAGWTYRVALNAARRGERRRSLERRLLTRQFPEAVVPEPAGELWAIVADLPRQQRAVVVLRYVADLTQVEIAQVLGISRSTVASTLVDAHNKLARLIADESPEPSPSSTEARGV